MKQQRLKLQDLELRIPAIDLIDAKKIIGGSYLDDTNTIDYGDIETIHVIEGPDPQGSGYDYEGDYDYDDDRDHDHDYDQHEQEDREPDERDEKKGIVKNGHCAIGSMALMVKEKTGCSTEEAIAKVMEAAEALGVSTEIIYDDEGNPKGIEIKSSQVEAILEECGVDANPFPDSNMSVDEIENFFNNGGVAYGFNGDWGHALFLDGFDRGSHTFHCRDSVDGKEFDINMGAFSERGGYIIGIN